MQALIIDLHISAQQLLKRYRGQTDTVVARSRDGRTVRFPADILRPFILHDGIHGTFCIHYDAEGHFHRISRLA